MSKSFDLGSRIDALLDRLYEKSAGQNEALGTYFSARAAEPSFDWNEFDARTNQFLSDKMVAPTTAVCAAPPATIVIWAAAPAVTTAVNTTGASDPTVAVTVWIPVAGPSVHVVVACPAATFK